MKPLGRFPIPALTLLIAVSGLYAKNVVSEVNPTEAGIVSGDRVNIRARASLIGERVAQLRKGDKVTVLAKVTVAPPRKGEPTDWLKITMPAAGQTWVHLSFVKEGKVTAKKLNARAGGSERFSIVGRLAKGDAVKEKRTAGDWIEIEHPAGAHAYVAAKFIELGQAAEETKPEPTPEAKPAELTERKSQKKPQRPSPPPRKSPRRRNPRASRKRLQRPRASRKNRMKPPSPGTCRSRQRRKSSWSMPPSPATRKSCRWATRKTPRKPSRNRPPAVTDTKLPVPPPRIVTREGTIKRRFFRSPKAPSRFELLDDNVRTINYLYSSDSGPLKSAKGEDGEPITFTNLMGMLRNRRVILTGIEAVDPRWPSLPLLDVRTLKTLP